MSNISLTDARGIFTKTLIDVYQERIQPKSFIRSFFPSVFAPTKLISIEVERGFEKIAVDVVRGSEGNFNRFSKSTEKTWLPPMWREYFNATELDIYDRVLGSQASDNSDLFAVLLNTVADRIGLLQAKIERSKELQCAQVLQTGIVTMENGDNIDFKRKAASIVDLNGAGGYWTTGATDVFAQFQAAGDFLRKTGKANSQRFISIMGASAIAALFKNTTFLTRQNLFNLALDAVAGPRMNLVGGVFHGTITAGPYTVELWSYPEWYDDASNVSTPYIDDDNVVVIPPAPRFKFAHALVPQLATAPGSTRAPQTGEWVLGEFMDERKAVHDFDIQCAGLPVPVAVDQIYTMKATA